jgi:hypothetical protein
MLMADTAPETMAFLRARTELARIHVFDHTLTSGVMALVVIGNSCLE